MLWDKYYENTELIMNDIDYERFYEEFDLGDYLTEPVGKFNREDLKNLLSANINTNSIATSAMFYGIRTAMSKELEKVNNSEEWKGKAHYIQQEDAIEILCRLHLLNRIKRDFRKE